MIIIIIIFIFNKHWIIVHNSYYNNLLAINIPYLAKITTASGRVPDCAEKHKGSRSTTITTSRQNTLLAHLAIVDQLISSYPVSCTCVCFQPYPLADPRPHLLRMRSGANTFARFGLSSQMVRQINNRERE